MLEYDKEIINGLIKQLIVLDTPNSEVYLRDFRVEVDQRSGMIIRTYNLTLMDNNK